VLQGVSSAGRASFGGARFADEVRFVGAAFAEGVPHCGSELP
jgi:hypothetical protein